MEVHDTIALFQILITALAAIAASSGFWMFMDKKRSKRDLTNKLVIGLAYVRIVELSMSYIKRGSITQDEYDVLCNYLYTPYLELGGNGSIRRLVLEVDKLPIKAERTDLSDFMGDVKHHAVK